MSRACQISGTKAQRGKKVTKVWGVKYRSIRHRQPNLVKTTLLVDGIMTQLKVCAKTLKSIKNGKYSNIKAIVYTADGIAK